MTLSVDQPWWLVGAVVAVPMAVLGLRWFASMSRLRRWSAVVLRTMLIVLLVGMLAGVSLVREADRLAVVVVVDISGSIRQFAPGAVDAQGQTIDPIERVRRWIEASSADRSLDDLLGVVLVDGRAVAIASPTRGEVLDRSFEVVPVEGTDLAAGLRLASALLPPDAAGRIVLVSDGNETAGDAQAVASRLAGDGRGVGVPVDIVPVVYEASREVIVESIDAPPTAAGESTVTLRVMLRATEATRGVLRLRREGEIVDINGSAPGSGRPITLSPGVTTELIELDLPPARLHRFEVVFEPQTRTLDDGSVELIGDTQLANNRAEAFTLTPGYGSVLVLDGVGRGDPKSTGAMLAHTLERVGVEVSLVAPEAMPASLLGLQSYDLIVMQNVAAEELSAAQHELLVAFVRDLGGGLVVVGGPDALGAGGWKGTAIEPILPVKLDLPERAITPEAAIVFVLDRSGSMSFTIMGSARTKQQVANESTAIAIRTLDQRDLVGVIAFSTGVDVVVPLGPNTDARASAARVLSIAPGGGTDLLPALVEAQRQLAAHKAKLKHVIVLSDGQSMRPERLPGFVASMKQQGISVTTIAVGDDADTNTMAQMARVGGGRFHHVLNPNVLPRVFMREVRIVRKPMIREQPFVPIVRDGASPLLTGLTEIPQLGGLVLTQRRTEATVVTALETPKGEPVLAHWRVGLGQVVVFTSDASGLWSSRWIDWPGYAQLWTTITRFASRAPGSGQYDLTTTIRDGRMQVRVEVAGADGTPLDLLSMPATVYAPSGEAIEMTLTQTGPGTYDGSSPVHETGGHIVVISPWQGGRRLAPVVGGATVASGAEYRRLRSNEALLVRIAELTGGRVLDLGERADLFDRAGIEPVRARTPIWRSLLILALVVLMLDIGTRRIAWDRLVGKEYGVGLRASASEALRDRGARASGVLAGLRSRRGGVADTIAGPGVLDDDDALRVADDQLARQRKAQLESIREARKRLRASADDLPESQIDTAPGGVSTREQTGSDAGTPDEPVAHESGLLAAKRRARERYEDQPEE